LDQLDLNSLPQVVWMTIDLSLIYSKVDEMRSTYAIKKQHISWC
jgi:hypothetical protein